MPLDTSALRLCGHALFGLLRSIGLSFGLLICSTQASDLSVRLLTGVLHEGRNARVEVRVDVDNEAQSVAELSYRIWQLTSSTAAPLTSVLPWKSVDLSRRRMVIETLDLTLPETRAITSFRIEFFRDGILLGAQPIIGLPSKIFAETCVAVPRAGSELGKQMSSLGIKVTEADISNSGRADLPANAFVLLGPFPSSEPRPADLEAESEAIRRSGHGVILLEAPAGSRPSLLNPIVLMCEKRDCAALVRVNANRFDRLGTSAEAQLALYECLELASGRHP